MNKIDYRIKGTKIPELPNNIEFKATFWTCYNHDKFYFNKMKQSNLISYGYIKHENEDCILVEDKNYTDDNYWIFKESDLINLTENMNKQNNLPKYWVVKNTNNDDFKVVVDYLNKTYDQNWGGWAKDYYYGYDGNFYYNGTNNNLLQLNFANNPTVLTLEEFKKAIGIEEEFVLPEKWCVKVTEETYEILSKTIYSRFTYCNTYLTSRLLGDGSIWNNWDLNKTAKRTGYTEITFEQFKKYVLNMQENNKKIIGYKLAKLEFEKASNALLDDDCTKWYSAKECKGYYCINKNDITINKLKKAGVLDLWFEPVYEEEIKTVNMGEFNLTIKDKKVFYKNEDITLFVDGIGKTMQSSTITNYKFNGYDFIIKDMIISKSGCQNTETKLSDWLKVYDMIK